MLRFAVLTISDRSYAGVREDKSGPALCKMIKQAGDLVVATALVPDEYDQIIENLTQWADLDISDVILTTGGTGFAQRDITPEATLQVVDRQSPGLAEAMRWKSLQITPHAMLSRAVAGIRKQTIIINLPGSPKAATENLAFIQEVLPHAVELLREKDMPDTHHQVK